MTVLTRIEVQMRACVCVCVNHLSRLFADHARDASVTSAVVARDPSSSRLPFIQSALRSPAELTDLQLSLWTGPFSNCLQPDTDKLCVKISPRLLRLLLNFPSLDFIFRKSWKFEVTYRRSFGFPLTYVGI